MANPWDDPKDTKGKSSPAPRRSSKKKSGGFGGFVRKFASGAEETARGLPTASLQSAVALSELMRGRPGKAGKIAKETVKGTAETVRHPLRDPFSTFLTALSVASLGGGSAARLAAGTKAFRAGEGLTGASRAAYRRPTFSRRYKLMPVEVKGKTIKRQKYNPQTKKSVTYKQQMPTSTYTPVATRPASRNPVSRGIGNIHEALYEASRKRAIDEKRGGGYAKSKAEKYTREKKRLQKQHEVGKQASIQHLQPAAATATQSTIHRRIPGVVTLPTSLLRLAMVSRPRYAVQNALQTGAYLAADQGPVGLARSVRQARRLRKTAPEIPMHVRGTMGSTGTGSPAIESKGVLARPTHWLAHKMSFPESRLRELAFYKAARDKGITTPKQFHDMFNRQSGLFQEVGHRANQAAVDYSRLGPNERFAMATGIPIFYPMFKGTSMWAGKYPFEHPLQAALFNQLGQQGFEQQSADFPGGLPVWSPYLTKVSDTETVNPTNVLPYGPFSDLSRQAAGAFRPGGPQSELLSLLQQVSPSVEAAYMALSGRSFESGWEDPYVKEGGSPFFSALRGLAPLVPFSDVLYPRETKAFGTPDWRDRALLYNLGAWATPRDTDFRVLAEQASRGAHDPDDPMSLLEEIRSLIRIPYRGPGKKKTPAGGGSRSSNPWDD